MNRREFLKNSAFASFAAAFGGCATFGGRGLAVNGVRIGVQMWSVDKLWKKNPVEAFRRLKAMGYDGVQSYGFYAMDWNELEKMLDGEGLEIVDMPFYLKTLKGDGEKRFVDFCRRFGVTFVYEPLWEKKATEEAWRNHVKELLAVRDRLAAQGLRVGFHDHRHDFSKFASGRCPMDLLFDAGLDFELDVGHARLAGHDPVAWLDRLVGRVPTIHAKPGGGNSIGGAGDANDWSAIFRAARAAGTKWAVVECETRRDTYRDVDDSMNYLRSAVNAD